MDVQQIARNCMEALTVTKRVACERHGGPSDLAPMVDVMFAGGERGMAVIPDRDAIVLAVDAIRADRGQPVTAVAFCAESYMKKMPVGLTLDSPEVQERLNRGRGLNTAEFEAGDLTITEALIVTVVDVKSGEMVGVVREFTYDDTGKPKFGQIDFNYEMLDGAVVDELRKLASS